MLDGHQASDLLAVAGDRHFLAALDQVEQLAEFVLRLERADLSHGSFLE
jgi:hypothetical protein